VELVVVESEVEEREEEERGKGEEEERRECRTASERSRRSAAATAQSCGPRPERRRAVCEWERGSISRLEERERAATPLFLSPFVACNRKALQHNQPRASRLQLRFLGV
jgi:hypothetical protein